MQDNPKAEKGEYQELPFYEEFIEWYGAFAPYIVMSICVKKPELKEVMTRNFISRAAVSLRGILALWRVKDYQGCWVSYRCLLDRLFHLHHLNRTDGFQDFDDWSFSQQYNSRNAIRSHLQFRERIDPAFFRDSEEDKIRAKALQKNPPKWERPFAEGESREMGLPFLYQQGYDYASTLVHPMANDGQQDYTTVTGFGGPWPDQVVVINNSCLAALLLLREAMDGSRLLWLGLVLRCMDEALTALKSGSREYLRLFVQLGKAAPDGNWCKHAESPSRDGESA